MRVRSLRRRGMSTRVMAVQKTDAGGRLQSPKRLGAPTGDEKWITNDKNVQKNDGQKASKFHRLAKPGLTRNKLMLCVWWDWKGIIYYEFLPTSKTISIANSR
ncbi:Mariner Mos1 transposase [Eumeta japonica]|uniref:Mariner Mos1 transposase n=1 Tax=Eumeta variegata TaxID=151549 RepID=A0A4C1XPU6_EUMVA|nr:Mariner Mos1 transposase [Eumeta japonica]